MSEIHIKPQGAMGQSDNFDRAVQGFTRGFTQGFTTTQGRNRASLNHWCDLARGMQVVRGQWKASILIALAEAAHDIPALQHRLDMANRRVLVRALRELEEDRLIARVPGASGHVLTRDGRALIPVLRDLAAWEAARDRSGD